MPKPVTKTNVRRGRPSKQYVKTLRKIKRKDWEHLCAATIMAMVDKQYSVFLKVSHLLKFPEGFPAFKILERDGFDNIIKVRTKTLMRYLIDAGHTTVTMYQLQQAQRTFTMQQNALDNLFNEAYNEPCEESFLNEQLGENDEQ